MDVSDGQTDETVWKFANGCNSRMLTSLLNAANIPTTNCVEGRLQLRLFHAVRMGLLSLEVDGKVSGSDQQKITVNNLAGMDNEQESRLGRLSAPSKVRRQKLKLGQYVTLLHPLQIDDWTRDMRCFLPSVSKQQQLQQMTIYLRKRKLHGTQEAKLLAAGKRLSVNRRCVHSVEYHHLGDDADICVCYVRGMVVPGHRNTKSRTHPYMVWCRVHKQTGAIQEADCHCTPGLESGVCLHILALLHHIAKLTEQSDERMRTPPKQACDKNSTQAFANTVFGVSANTTDMPSSEAPGGLDTSVSLTHRKSLVDYDLDRLAEITNGDSGLLMYANHWRTPHPTLSVEPDLMHIGTDVQVVTGTPLTLPLQAECPIDKDPVTDPYEKWPPHVTAVGHHLLHHQKEPVVFPNTISHWPAASWTPNTLKYLLKDQLLTFRIGRQSATEVQWETECDYESATMSEFVDWISHESVGFPNSLSTYNSSANWCYCDYKHFMQHFPDRPEILKAVDWAVFGFPGRGGEKSTFWMGSAGAHTQCHFDSYGCNLVAQIYGRKRWVLFPPSQMHLLYPTRIPYEESSVFSNVKVDQPDLRRHPKFKETTPYVVTLEPGDVLYVPRHWWHDVTSLTTSISINTWIELLATKEPTVTSDAQMFGTIVLVERKSLPCDNEERLREAVTRTVVMTTMRDTERGWLNPNEELSSFEENIDCLRNALLLAIAADGHLHPAADGQLDPEADGQLHPAADDQQYTATDNQLHREADGRQCSSTDNQLHREADGRQCSSTDNQLHCEADGRQCSSTDNQLHREADGRQCSSAGEQLHHEADGRQCSSADELPDCENEAARTPSPKRARLDPRAVCAGHCSCARSYPQVQWAHSLGSANQLRACQFDEYCLRMRIRGGVSCSDRPTSDCGVRTEGLEAALVNSLSHPLVVRRVCKLLKENFRL